MPVPTNSETSKIKIIRELLQGKTPAALARDRFANGTNIYSIYNQLVKDGFLPLKPDITDTERQAIIDTVINPQLNQDTSDDDVFTVDSDGTVKPPTMRGGSGMPINVTVTDSAHSGNAKGTEQVAFAGEPTFPLEVAERIRGILGISARPKVLMMPMPEMLYPAMVISVAELHFPAMKPEDFIDTVLYQWLEGCGYIPRAYIKKSDLEKLIEKPSKQDEERKFDKWARDKGLVTLDDIIGVFADKMGLPRDTVAEVFLDGHGNGDNHGNGDGDNNGDGDGHHGDNHNELPDAVKSPSQVIAVAVDVPHDDTNGVTQQHQVVQAQSVTQEPTISAPTIPIEERPAVVNSVPTAPPVESHKLADDDRILLMAREVKNAITAAPIPDNNNTNRDKLIMEKIMSKTGLSERHIVVIEKLASGASSEDIMMKLGLNTSRSIRGLCLVVCQLLKAHDMTSATSKFMQIKAQITKEVNGG